MSAAPSNEKSGMDETATTSSAEETKAIVQRFQWAIRPCEQYKDEYKDCTSMRSRFHQYFVHGEFADCSQWKTDCDDCLLYERKEDFQAALRVIRSEKNRREIRLGAHYANTVWTKRTEPPSEWEKPLPDWLQKRDENTFLAIKSREMKGEKTDEFVTFGLEPKSLCPIM